MEWIRIKKERPKAEGKYLALTETGVTKVMAWTAPGPNEPVPNKWRGVVGWAEIPDIPQGFDHELERIKIHEALERAMDATADVRQVERELKSEMAAMRKKVESWKKEALEKLDRVIKETEALLGRVDEDDKEEKR